MGSIVKKVFTYLLLPVIIVGLTYAIVKSVMEPVEFNKHKGVLAGSTGLEPATPGSTVQCANQLRHNPVFRKSEGIIPFLRSMCKGYIYIFCTA